MPNGLSELAGYTALQAATLKLIVPSVSITTDFVGLKQLSVIA